MVKKKPIIIKLLLSPRDWGNYFLWSHFGAKLLYVYIRPIAGKLFKNWLLETSQGKVLTFDQIEKILLIKRNSILKNVNISMPFASVDEFDFEWPLPIAVYECACRSFRKKPCLPMQVCLVIGKETVNFLNTYFPNKTRSITHQAALEIVIQNRIKLGMNSMYINKKTINICNDTKCCCGILEMVTKQHYPILHSSGYVASVLRVDKCIGCGACAKACPFNAIEIVNKNVMVILEKCFGCGVCLNSCAQNVFELVRDEKKGPVLEIDESKVL